MSISTAASQCTQLLAQAQCNKALDPTLRLNLENILVRFKIWAGNVGVFAPENASTEYRLRQDADITDVLLSMLATLKANLEKAINPPLREEPEGGEGPSSVVSVPSIPANSSRSPSRSPSPSLVLDSDEAEEGQGNETQNNLGPENPVERANDVIDRLYRLASVLRKPVSSTENSKVRDFIDKQTSGGVWEDLKDVEDHILCHMQARFAKAPRILVDRLVAATRFRRMKLRYRQRHQEKLRQGVESSFSAESWDANQPFSEGPPTAAVLHAIPIPQLAPSGTGKKFQNPKPGRSVAWSATDASSINRSKFANYAKSATLSAITRSAVARRQNLDVPLPPQNFDWRLQKVTCSYCMRMISKQETEEPRWT